MRIFGSMDDWLEDLRASSTFPDWLKRFETRHPLEFLVLAVGLRLWVIICLIGMAALVGILVLGLSLLMVWIIRHRLE